MIKVKDKTFDTVHEMFDDMNREFKNNYPIKYWIDYSLFPDKGFFGYAPHHFFTHPWIAIEFVSQEIRWAWQRVFKGFDERIIWSIDWYLAEKIPVWIKALKNKQHGIPMEMFDGLPHDDNYCYSDKDEKIAENRWFNILYKIIIGFESYYKIQEECLFEKDPEFFKLNENYEIGFDLFKKYFGNLWD